MSNYRIIWGLPAPQLLPSVRGILLGRSPPQQYSTDFRKNDTNFENARVVLWDLGKAYKYVSMCSNRFYLI